MRMYTYFEPVARLEGHVGLLDLWRERWSANGWEPVVLGRGDAMGHADWRRCDAGFRRLPSANPEGYDLTCYRRWLAVAAAGGGWMSDWDAIPYGFSPRDAPDGLMLWGGPGIIPSLVSGCAGDFTRAARTFAEWRGPMGSGRRRHVSDMLILQIAWRFYGHEPVCLNYGSVGWDRAPVVHYSNGTMHLTGRTDARQDIIPDLRRFEP